jgi:CheY-like chemotaxis protein
VQQLKADELAKLDRQKLRLPRCAGDPVADELDNIENYLDIVMEHRKAPPNASDLPTMCCLEGTPYGPKSNANGPAVTALLKAAAQEGTGRRHNRSGTSGFKDWLEPLSYDSNPMGSVAAANARYAETAPPGARHKQLAINDTLALQRCDSSPEVGGAGGVFLHTEVSFDDGMSVSLVQDKTMVSSISMPSLSMPSLSQGPGAFSDEVTSPEIDPVKKAREDAKAASTKRNQRVMKAFAKCMTGKSILILTDKKELRKQITSVLLADGTQLIFIKSSIELWTRLREPKEKHHALLIDLTKNELQVEPMLRTIRGDFRYGHLPVIVLSSDRELSDMVRTSCSFVVFLPLAASMLREALVWCFDRRSVQKMFRYEEKQEDVPALVTGTAAVVHDVS